MSRTTIVLGLIYSTVLDGPLNIITSNKQSIFSKLISGIAIGALSLLSGGLYTIHIYNFFAHRKAINLQKELEQAIDSGDCSRVLDLFRRYPALKVAPDAIHGIKSDSLLSLMLPLPAEQGRLEMVKLLCENGAKLDAFSRGQKTALERALDQNHEDVAKYLLERGATVFEQTLYHYFTSSRSNIDMMIYLVEKSKNVNSEMRNLSILGLAALRYDEDPEKCKKLLQLLVEKGDRLIEGDELLSIPEEAKNFIHDQIKLMG